MSAESETKNGINVENGQKPLNKKNSILTFKKRNFSALSSSYEKGLKMIYNPGVEQQLSNDNSISF